MGISAFDRADQGVHRRDHVALWFAVDQEYEALDDRRTETIVVHAEPQRASIEVTGDGDVRPHLGTQLLRDDVRLPPACGGRQCADQQRQTGNDDVAGEPFLRPMELRAGLVNRNAVPP